MSVYDFSAGKLDYSLLKELIGDLPLDERVVVGPRIGEDAAVVDMGDRYLVASTDPITFATDLIGWYAVHVNANDVATMGAKPLWFLATVLLPEGKSDEKLVREIFAQMKGACMSLDISFIGGHSEITPELPRPIVVGTMLGEVEKGKLVTSGGAQVGDAVLVTKGVPIEGTAIIAREKAEELLNREIPKDIIERAQNFLFDPGISVVRDALIACSVANVHAMHDPTEGGLARGLWELAEASLVTIEVDVTNLPVVPEGQQLCQAFGLNPLGTISSGTLLICVAEHEASEVIKALESANISVACVGRVTGKGEVGVFARQPCGKLERLPDFPKDEIVRIF
ncbi:MAG: AIR synthase family protein [Armatimonadetes bacterium]|nr:AIR synthase family protein [Armatimonadota bacterium]